MTFWQGLSDVLKQPWNHYKLVFFIIFIVCPLCVINKKGPDGHLRDMFLTWICHFVMKFLWSDHLGAKFNSHFGHCCFHGKLLDSMRKITICKEFVRINRKGDRGWSKNQSCLETNLYKLLIFGHFGRYLVIFAWHRPWISDERCVHLHTYIS